MSAQRLTPAFASSLSKCENLEIHAVLYHVRGKVARQRSEELRKLFERWDRRNEQVKASPVCFSFTLYFFP